MRNQLCFELKKGFTKENPRVKAYSIELAIKIKTKCNEILAKL